jgi:hypothetical protein
MMPRCGAFGLLASAITAMLGGCGFFSPTYTYHYKISLEIETPEGLRTGFAVRQVSWSAGKSVTQEASTASMSHEGEAVVVDLPNGQSLFALMSPDGQETPMLAFGSARQTLGSDRSIKELHPPQQAEVLFGQSGYPRLVRFRDMTDPRTVEKVDPADLAASYGPGFRLKRITAQIVDEPVTVSIGEKLNWLTRAPGTRINPPKSPSDFSGGPPFYYRDFWRSGT